MEITLAELGRRLGGQDSPLVRIFSGLGVLAGIQGRVFDGVLHASITTPMIRKVSGLSAHRVSRALRELCELGLIAEPRHERGRPIYVQPPDDEADITRVKITAFAAKATRERLGEE